MGEEARRNSSNNQIVEDVSDIIPNENSDNNNRNASYEMKKYYQVNIANEACEEWNNESFDEGINGPSGSIIRGIPEFKNKHTIIKKRSRYTFSS